MPKLIVAVPSPSASDPHALIGRFRADLQALGVVPSHGRPLAVAVSGGRDSMAMLWLAAANFSGAVVAATVDHRLRAGSAEEAAMVARWCAAHDVLHAILAPDRPIVGASLQAQARAARYALLAEWALASKAVALATAHHRDDQAETFLMRAARGSGPGGLAGIRPSFRYEHHRWRSGHAGSGVVADADATPLSVVRPVLGWARQELDDIVSLAELPVVDDPSNGDDRFDRTRVRSMLANNLWLSGAGLAAAAAHAREADETLSAWAEKLWRERRVIPTGVDAPDDQIWIDIQDLARPFLRQLSRAAINDVRSCRGITNPRFFDAGSANVEALLDALIAGRAATRAGVLATPVGHVWRFTEAPRRRSPAT